MSRFPPFTSPSSFPGLAVLLLLFLLSWPAGCDELISDYDGYNAAVYGVFPRQTFKSIPELIDAPKLQVTTWRPEAMDPSAGSHIFLRHDGHHAGSRQDAAPLILSAEDLSVVYVNRSFNAVFDVRVQENGGQSYLTFYGGPMTEVGLGNGYAHAFDQSYREAYHIAPQNLSVKGDLHECQFTGDGTVMVTAYETVPWDLSHLPGGSRFASIVDSVFQEVDLETNEVVFEWRASDHVPMEGSYQNIERRWDYFHLNSIEKTRGGDYLLSARHMHAIYLVNGTSGAVLWTLGGKANEFAELPAFGDNATEAASNPVLTMAWQHHARFYRGNESEITFFDNHVLAYNGYNCERDCSRGLHVALDTRGTNKTVRLVHEYLHPQGLQSQSQGSVQALANGHTFVGWGRNPSFTQHDAAGDVVLSVQFSPWRSRATGEDGLDNYRAFRMDWRATPYWPPDLVVEAEAERGGRTAYVSWNGATEVRYWALLASNASHDLDGAAKVVAKLPRAGFETAIPVGQGPDAAAGARYVRVAAIDAQRNIIGASGIFDTLTGNLTAANYSITNVGHLVNTTAAEGEGGAWPEWRERVLGWWKGDLEESRGKWTRVDDAEYRGDEEFEAGELDEEKIPMRPDLVERGQV
ncbi:Arylsulfotransferase-domain-containing protein [Xylariaceae sp. FL0016]|nr:Arylsulfotransferase-domain-containing protein [Xylariaceae sp. FL0016]